MRADLAKCTTECYRRGAGSLEQIYKLKFGGKVRVHSDPDHHYENEHGGFRSSARHRHKESKDFGDKLGALRGNLRANLGRPWDDVFSEFCQVLDRRGLSGWHIWTHLKWEVSTNTFMNQGKVCEQPNGFRYGSREPAPVTGFYVHPISGLLLYNINEKYNRVGHQPIRALPVPGMEPWEYRKINGLWFRCVIVRRKDAIYSWRVDEFVETKRSCSKKEIAWIKEQLN